MSAIENPRGVTTNELGGSPSFKVLIPGMSGGGRDVNGIRAVLHDYYGDGVFVPSSISTVAARRANPGITGYYDRLGREILERSNNTDQIEMIFHSLGGIEAVQLLKGMIKDPRIGGKELSLTFMALPGAAENGLGGVVHTVSRLSDQFRHAAAYEQHMLYPLPEKCYQQSDVAPEGTKPVFKDTMEARSFRRELFAAKFLPAIVRDEGKTKGILNQLQQLDEILNTDPTNLQALHDRQELLKPLLFALYHGEHLPERVHQEMLARYGELAQASRFKELLYQLQALPILYLAEAGKTIGEGVSKRLVREVQALQKAGAKVKVKFAILGRDVMLPATDIPVLDASMRQELTDAFEGFLYVEQFAHSGTGYYPGVLTEVYSK